MSILFAVICCAQIATVAPSAKWDDDHSAQIQAAIDTHWSGNTHTVVLPDGWITIKQPLRLWRLDGSPHTSDYAHGLTIRGGNRTLVWVDIPDGSPAINIEGAYLLTLEHFRLYAKAKGAGTALFATQGTTQGSRPSRGVTVRNMQFDRFALGACVGDDWGPDITQLAFINCIFSDNTTHMKFHGANVDAFVERCTLGRGSLGAWLVPSLGATSPPSTRVSRGGSPRVMFRDMTTSVVGTLFKCEGPVPLAVEGCRAEGSGVFAEINNQAATNNRWDSSLIRCSSTMGQSVRFIPYGDKRARIAVSHCHFPEPFEGEYELVE